MAERSFRPHFSGWMKGLLGRPQEQQSKQMMIEINNFKAGTSILSMTLIEFDTAGSDFFPLYKSQTVYTHTTRPISGTRHGKERKKLEEKEKKESKMEREHHVEIYFVLHKKKSLLTKTFRRSNHAIFIPILSNIFRTYHG